MLRFFTALCIEHKAGNESLFDLRSARKGQDLMCAEFEMRESISVLRLFVRRRKPCRSEITIEASHRC